MTNKELKTFLKEKANNVQINDNHEKILNNVCDITPTIIPYRNNKRYGRLIMLSSVAVCFVLATTLITTSLIKNRPSSGHIEDVSKPKELLTYEVAALGNIIPSENISTIRKLSNSNIENEEEIYTKEEATQLADEIHSYLLTGEMLFNKDNFKATHIENDNLNYDFEHKLVVEYEEKAFSSNYTMYYNEYRKIDSDKELDEVNTTLDGIMLINKDTYKVTGEKEIIKDGYFTSLTIYTNENSYVRISQETLINENEYKYDFVENGKLVKEMLMEVNDTFLYSSMSIKINESFSEKEYSFNYKKDYIICGFDKMENEEPIYHQIKIEIFDNYYLYDFSEDIKIKKEK